MEDRTEAWTASPRTKLALLLLILTVGAAVRLYRFPNLPAGLGADEVSSSYESYSLLHAGADLWGNRLPVYFIGLGSGSGQNALQAYLSIPVVAAWGLTPFSARLVTLICSLLTLPLFFLTLRRWSGDAAAFLGLLFLALSPWHIVLSRWALECNPLPFFVLLGIFLYGRALRSTSPWAILPCLLPFSLSPYAHGSGFIILPVLLPLLFLTGYDPIVKQVRAWFGALALFLLVLAPFGLFLFKNFVFKRAYSFEPWLPFSVPLTPVTRLSEVRPTQGGLLSQERHVIGHNLLFFLHGLRDNFPSNGVAGYPPVQWLVLGLAAFGTSYQLAKLVRRHRFSEPFLPWLLATLPLFLISGVNINQSNSLFIPLLAMAALGAVVLFDAVGTSRYKIATAAVALGLFLFSTARFLHAYFGPAHSRRIALAFDSTLRGAMAAAQDSAAPNASIYISENIVLNSAQTLYYMNVDPYAFQHSGATYAHPDFGPYKFSRATALQTPTPIVFLLRKGEPPLCQNPTNTQQIGEFTVGECLARK